jgi:hypothetical protein
MVVIFPMQLEVVPPFLIRKIDFFILCSYMLLGKNSDVRCQGQLLVGTWNMDSNMLYISLILYICLAASIGVNCSNFG